MTAPAPAAGPDEPPATRVRHRFVFLLGGLVLLLVSAPFVDRFATPEHELLPHLVMGVVFFLMLLSAVVAVSETPRQVVLAGLLAAPAVVLWFIDLKFEHDPITLAQMASGMVFLAYVVVMVVRWLFAVERVTYNTIAAALCVYLLLGVWWAEAYSILALTDPASFVLEHPEEDKPFQMRVGGRGATYSLYFSFVTMTTVGYGDITPASAPARSFAILEAVMGQIYLAVLVGRLVALHIVHSPPPRP